MTAAWFGSGSGLGPGSGLGLGLGIGLGLGLGLGRGLGLGLDPDPNPNPNLQGARPGTVLCHDCCTLIASGGAEDGSGSVAVGKGKGASRLACAETVQQLCELGRAWWDLKKQEQAEREQQQQALKGPVPSRPATTRSR